LRGWLALRITNRATVAKRREQRNIDVPSQAWCRHFSPGKRDLTPYAEKATVELGLIHLVELEIALFLLAMNSWSQALIETIRQRPVKGFGAFAFLAMSINPHAPWQRRCQFPQR
jgi:hypothetical protein